MEVYGLETSDNVCTTTIKTNIKHIILSINRGICVT
jgi:hypothetical protein